MSEQSLDSESIIQTTKRRSRYHSQSTVRSLSKKQKAEPLHIIDMSPSTTRPHHHSGLPVEARPNNLYIDVEASVSAVPPQSAPMRQEITRPTMTFMSRRREIKTYFYCHVCKDGPMLLTNHPMCTQCDHVACSQCTYKKW